MRATSDGQRHKSQSIQKMNCWKKVASRIAGAHAHTYLERANANRTVAVARQNHTVRLPRNRHAHDIMAGSQRGRARHGRRILRDKDAIAHARRGEWPPIDRPRPEQCAARRENVASGGIDGNARHCGTAVIVGQRKLALERVEAPNRDAPLGIARNQEARKRAGRQRLQW